METLLNDNEEQLILDYFKETDGLDAEQYSKYLQKKPMTIDLKYALMKREALEVHLSNLRDEEPNRSILNSKLKGSFIQNELSSLNEFIDKAKAMVGLFSKEEHDYPDGHKHRNIIIYINLMTDHYLNKGAWYAMSEVSKVYAKYFLWKEYLEHLAASPNKISHQGKLYFEGLSAKEIAMLLRYLYDENKKLNKFQIEEMLKNVDNQNSYGNIATYFNNIFKNEFYRVHHPKDDSPKSISDHQARFVNVIKKLELIGNTKGLEKAKSEFNLFQEKHL